MSHKMIFHLILVLGLLCSSLPGGFASAQETEWPVETEVPGGLDEEQVLDGDWWAAIQEGILRQEYHITWQEGTYLTDLPAAYQAPNRAENLRSYFTPEGLVLIPREGYEGEDPLPWRWEASLVAWGREGGLVAVTPASLDVQENQITYTRPGNLLETYFNETEGLQQSFTLRDSPPGGQLGQPVQIQMALGGDLDQAQVEEGQQITFGNVSGTEGMRYGQLRAADASGRMLPVWLDLEGRTLSIWVEDSDAAYPITVLAGISGLNPDWSWAITFGQAGAEFGISVATAGDVDGDGYSDVIVGAYYYDGGYVKQGAAFLYYGSWEGLMPATSWIKIGNHANALFGRSVATAGDVNGDGYSDVIIGAPGHTDGEAAEGGMWVYHGSASGLGDAAAKYAQGNQMNASFGYSVATAGDVNGDGYSDVIVGAPLYSNLETQEGKVWVWHGSSSGLQSLNWSAESNQDLGFMGSSVATAGDVNRDGYADIVIGAYHYSAGELREGAAFIWLGSSNGVNNGAIGNPTNAHRHLQINQEFAHFGWSVSTAGDVNRDGFADVIVGAPDYTNGQDGEGGAWLYLGSDSGLNITASNQDEGNNAGAHFGYSVGTAGDVNGDGRSDVIVGAPHYTVSLNQQGRAFLWHGQDTAAGISITRNWDAAGEQAEANFGMSVFTAGDVNGDGYSDVIVGAPGHASRAGRAYVYHGRADTVSVSAGWTKRSNQAQALFGMSVGSAGDVNGDGFADVIVGAPRWDSGHTNEGAAWVYLGSATGLLTVPHWYKTSGQAGADYGISVGSAGDVNGDGYSDIIVGAPLWTNPEASEGAAFVYTGSSTGLDQTAGPLWAKASDQAGAQFGTSVSTAGDVNGDGYADIIVGAPYWQVSGSIRGAAWVYYGSPGGPHTTPDWYKAGGQADAQFGYSVASAGDVNGDSYSDVIIGSPLWEDDVVNEGRAVVYLGSRAGLRSEIHWQAEGNNFSAWMGYSVGTAGDVNGDGFADVIVGGPYYGDDGLEIEGKAWVFHGSATGLATSASWSREGGQNGVQYGYSVGTAGDVNGDGYADVIIGIRNYTAGEPYEGSASLYHGSRTGLRDTRAWSGESNQISAHYGTSVGTAGDVNGDGYAEVIIGAPNYNSSSELLDEGQAYLYYGNGGKGVNLQPVQKQYEGNPLAHLGITTQFDAFAIFMRVQSPFGSSNMDLEVEVRPLGVSFTGAPTGVRDYRYMPLNTYVGIPISYLVPGTAYHWRARWYYYPSTTPFMPASRWVTRPWNGWNEQDFRTSGNLLFLPLTTR